MVWSAAILAAAALFGPAQADTTAVPAKVPQADLSHTVQLVVNDRILAVWGYILEGHTMVPLRAVAEAMNGQIAVDPQTKNITMSFPDLTVKFALEQRETSVNERRILMSKAPCRLQGTTYIPLRFFVDSCGARLDWSDYPKIAYLYSRDFQYERSEFSHGAIKAVFVSPHRELVSGDVLNIEVLALPASRVTLDIEGLQSDIPTYEERPGCYKAQLSISDTMKTFEGAVTANLVQNSQTARLTSHTKVSVNTPNSPSAHSTALRYSPGSNSHIVSRRPNITISYDDYSLQKDSIHLWFDEQEYTHQISYRTNCAIWRPAGELAFGKHHVRFSAKDTQGTPVTCDWYFAVVPDREFVSDSSALPTTKLRVSSPRFGDSVSDIFLVIGRATAGANVTVTVSEREGHERGIVSSPGITLTRTVKADLTGRFQAEFDVSAVRAGHRLGIVAEAELNTNVSQPYRIEVIRR